MKTEETVQNRSSGKERRMSSNRGRRKLVEYSTPASQEMRNFPEDCGGLQ